MSNFFIGIGKCSKRYKYILYYTILRLINNILNDIISYKFEFILPYHKIIKSIYKYFGYIIFGLLFIYIRRRKSKKVNNNSEKDRFSLIYIQKEANDIKDNYLTLIIILLILVLHQELIMIMGAFLLYPFNFWIFGIIFINIFLYKYYKAPLNYHQKCSLVCFGFLF